MPGRSYNLNNYRYNYQGQERADNSNWQNFELRMHNPDLGRWMSPDPYGQFFSPYVSMGNDPVSGTDPDGGLTNAGQTPSWESINNGNAIMKRQYDDYAAEQANRWTSQKRDEMKAEIRSKHLDGWGNMTREGAMLFEALDKEFGEHFASLHDADDPIPNAANTASWNPDAAFSSLDIYMYNVEGLIEKKENAETKRKAAEKKNKMMNDRFMDIEGIVFGGNPEDWRPDDDGKLTFSEAIWWYRLGEGQPLSIDLNSLDLSSIKASDFKYGENSSQVFNLFKFPVSEQGLIYGSITLYLMEENKVFAYPDIYNFDLKMKSETFKRDAFTIIDHYYNGGGKAYDINFYNSVKIKP